MISVEDEIRLRIDTAVKTFDSIVLNSRVWNEAQSVADANMVADLIVDNAIKKSLNLEKS